MTKTISIVVAVYRNREALRPTHDELTALFAPGNPLAGYGREFVFVDDGSDDGSWDELELLHQADPSVKVLSFSRNFGQIPAVIAGFRAARGDAVINKAADQQEPPHAVVEMVRAWERGARVVLGRRTTREDAPAARLLGNAYWAILKQLNPNLPVGSDFFLLDRQAVDLFNAIDESDRFFPVDVLWLGFRPTIVPYERRKRLIGQSQWRTWRKVKAGIDGILHSSYVPIRLISLLGLCVAASGCLLAVAIVPLQLAADVRYRGWYSIVSLLLLLQGFTMLTLGVIGEYVWRIYNQVKHRPEYIIQRRLGA